MRSTLDQTWILATSFALFALLANPACKNDDDLYTALNGEDDCVLVDVLAEEDGDDDDSAEDEEWVDLTCCGGDVVIGEAVVSPGAAQVGDTRYAAARIDRDAFEATGADLDDLARVSVSFDDRGVGTGEVDLERDGLEETLWDGWLGNGELGGVPRTDQLCFHLWGEEETDG